MVPAAGSFQKPLINLFPKQTLDDFKPTLTKLLMASRRLTLEPLTELGQRR
jgi:hypothetical protein